MSRVEARTLRLRAASAFNSAALATQQARLLLMYSRPHRQVTMHAYTVSPESAVCARGACSSPIDSGYDIFMSDTCLPTREFQGLTLTNGMIPNVANTTVKSIVIKVGFAPRVHMCRCGCACRGLASASSPRRDRQRDRQEKDQVYKPQPIACQYSNFPRCRWCRKAAFTLASVRSTGSRTIPILARSALSPELSRPAGSHLAAPVLSQTMSRFQGMVSFRARLRQG